MEFFPNVFTEFSEKIFVNAIKRVKPATSCVRDQNASTNTSKAHVIDRIFKLSPTHTSVIIRFPEFSEFRETSVAFRENSFYSAGTTAIFVYYGKSRMAWRTVNFYKLQRFC